MLFRSLALCLEPRTPLAPAVRFLPAAQRSLPVLLSGPARLALCLEPRTPLAPAVRFLPAAQPSLPVLHCLLRCQDLRLLVHAVRFLPAAQVLLLRLCLVPVLQAGSDFCCAMIKPVIHLFQLFFIINCTFPFSVRVEFFSTSLASNRSQPANGFVLPILSSSHKRK